MAKSFNRVAVFLLVFGLLFLGLALYWATRVQAFVQEAAVVNGTVIDLERSRSSDSTSYFPVVRFRTKAGQERTFRSSSGSNPPSYRVGETVEVLYLESEPSDARIRGYFSLWGGPTIVGAMGVIFALIGGGIIYVRRRSAERAAYLRRKGRPVETEFQGVEQNTSFKVNGRSPWRIVTQWKNPATGEIHLFQSDNLWFDPSAHIASKRIIVYLDPASPKRYYMDISFLPKLAA